MENTSNQNQGFDFGTFIEDSKKALLSPKDYFSSMPTSGGFVEPLIKVLIYGAIMGVFSFIWLSTGMQFTGGIGLFGGAIGIMAFIGSLLFAVIGLFLGGVIMLVISAILGGNTDYEANVRVVASLMIISAVQGLFGFFDGVSLYLAALVSVALGSYGLYMTYHALVQSLKAKENGSKILRIVLAALIVIFSFTGIAAKKKLQNFSNKYDLENFQDLSEDEMIEKAANIIENASDGEVKADEFIEAMEEIEESMDDLEKTLEAMEEELEDDN